MKNFDLSRFLYVYANFATMRQAMTKDGTLSFSEKDLYDLKKDADALKEQLQDFGLNAAAVSARKLRETLDMGDEVHGSYKYKFSNENKLLIDSFVRDIGTRTRDELENRIVFFLPRERQGLFLQASPLFGSEVAQKFPSAAYEIAEAGKCLALDRHTASVFHSLRGLEAAIRALARSLAIPDPTKPADRSWFKLLKTIFDEMAKRWPGTADRMNGDGRFFEEAHAALAAMQNPYRNSTMHLDQKYTEEEASDIFDIVKAFMRKLSSRMDEDGLPLA